MISFVAFGALALGGPFKINGQNIPAHDLMHTGQVTYRAALASINGGHVSLKPLRQQAVDKIMSASGTIVLAMTDNSWTDTVLFTFGSMKLVRKLDTWYWVNTTDQQWRQLNLGPVVKGSPINLGVVEDGANAHIFFNGKDCGMTPYDSKSSQPIGIGSPTGEPTPWQGEVRGFEVFARQLTATDLTTRFAMLSPSQPVAEVTPSTSTTVQTAPATTGTSTPPANPPATTNPTPTTPPATTTNNPPPSNPTPSNPTGADVAKTKSAVIVVDIVEASDVPDPKTILPYRHALVTEECKVVEVTSGHIDKVDVGKMVRVARWGIVGGQKTDVANTKKGDRVQLTIELFADHPDLANFYTIDTIAEDYTAQYVLDTSRKAPGGGGGGGTR